MNATTSLVGQLLSAAGNAGTAGATPYGMIVSAGTAAAAPPTLEIPTQEGAPPDVEVGSIQVFGEEQSEVLSQPPPELRRIDSSCSVPMAEKPTAMDATTPMQPLEIRIPEVAGYTDLAPVYSLNHIHVYRAKSSLTEKAVMLKLCTVNHLDTLARLRLEWKMLSDIPTPGSKVAFVNTTASSTPTSEHYSTGSVTSTFSAAKLASMPNVVRPYAWDYLQDEGITLVYSDEPTNMTVREAFLPDRDGKPHILGTSPALGPATPAPPAPKPRTQSDLIKILSVFSSVVGVLDCAHKAGVTHNNINTFSILVARASNSSGIQGKLGGWHLASRLERQELGRSAGGAMLRGENPAPLQYIAPECTGRMNRSVDYRADFYSLGVALYELVVGFLVDPRQMLFSSMMRANFEGAAISVC